MPPLVTAIVPTYNRAALLVRALASIAAQDYDSLEVIIVDDGSTDETADLIPAQREILATRDVELIYHRQINGGPAKARNTGIGMARGSLISFLDSDDLWRPTFVSTLARLLDRYPSAGVAFCGIQGIDIHDTVFAERELGIPGDASEGMLPKPFDFLINHMALQTSGVMVRRNALDPIGVFDLSLPVGEDWDLWYRLAREYDFAYSKQALACNRHHANNIPKWDARALAMSLVLNLRYLPLATNLDSRGLLRERITRDMTLLQEELLRLGKPANGYTPLLENDQAPGTLRYEVGRLMRQQPEWVGRAYATVVRAAGRTRELLSRSAATP